LDTSLYFAVPAVSAAAVKEKGVKWPHGGLSSLGFVFSIRKSKIQAAASILSMVLAMATTVIAPAPATCLTLSIIREKFVRKLIALLAVAASLGECAVAPGYGNAQPYDSVIQSTAITRTGQGRGPGAIAAPGAAVTAITGTATVGTVASMADVEVGVDMAAKVGVWAGADMAAEADTAAAADTFRWSGSIRPAPCLTFRFESSQSELAGASPCLRK
jgi:hypothetical protein